MDLRRQRSGRDLRRLRSGSLCWRRCCTRSQAFCFEISKLATDCFFIAILKAVVTITETAAGTVAIRVLILCAYLQGGGMQRKVRKRVDEHRRKKKESKQRRIHALTSIVNSYSPSETQSNVTSVVYFESSG